MSESHPPRIRLSRPVSGALIISALVLLLQVPVALIRDVIEERVDTRNEALGDVTGTWGGPQSIIGPRLVIPYRIPSSDHTAASEAEVAYASFLPASLSVEGELMTERLRRGLFTIPVYHARLSLRGSFDEPDLNALDVDPADLIWERATLAIEVSDPKSVGGESSVSWDGGAVDLLPGTAPAGGDRPGVHSRVAAPTEGAVDFDVELELKGAEAIWFVPFSRNTRVEIRSNWSAPSFSGAWLPTARAVQEGGFSAEWQVPFLGRDYPQQWTSQDEPHERILVSRFGAELISPVDHYRMSVRSTKYAPLFLALTFGLLWVFDTLAGVRLHPVQYLLVGAAMCLFYLLELSLSEHMGFTRAYFAAAASVAGLIAAYTTAILRSVRRGVLVGGALGLLYSYLLALLALERYALLAGSLGLFALLALVMYLTRWIDWHWEPHSAETAGT